MDQYLVSTVVIVSFLLGCCLLALVKNASKLTSAQRLSVFALLGFFVFWVILSWCLAQRGFYLRKDVLQFSKELSMDPKTSSLIKSPRILPKEWQLILRLSKSNGQRCFRNPLKA